MTSIRRSTRRRLTRWLTLGVLGLQVALVAAFVLDPVDPPRGAGTLPQALWALAHKPAFYPLIGLLILGPVATWFAVAERGPHRRVLAVAWVVFIAVIAVFFAHRFAVMIQLLFRHGAG